MNSSEFNKEDEKPINLSSEVREQMYQQCHHYLNYNLSEHVRHRLIDEFYSPLYSIFFDHINREFTHRIIKDLK